MRRPARLRLSDADRGASDPGLAQRVDLTAAVDRLLLGSNYPFAMHDPRAVARVEHLAGAIDPDRAAILGGNAVELFGLDR